MQQKMNFNHCIFDHFEIPADNSWAYELLNKKIEKDKQWEIIKNILEKNATKTSAKIY